MRSTAILLLLFAPFALAAEETATPSEKDYLAEMPIVLSVSRLSQSLDETPSAVTILDRDTIRKSGARSITDLLRLVPGFEVSNAYEGGAPIATYHGGFGDFSSRLQVFIDGRSTYSAYFMGTAGFGLQTIALEDVERIEVLRGSNSAAYGARAVLGMINIITRDPLDTLGVGVSKNSGQNGIDDYFLRVGGGDETANFRLSASRRGDAGLSGPLGHDNPNPPNSLLSGPNGSNHTAIVNFRANLRPNTTDEVELHAGLSDQFAGAGNGFTPGSPYRERHYGASHIQADWKRVLGQDADLAASFSHTGESFTDNFPYALPPPFYGTTVDFGGGAGSDALLVQHTFRVDPELRIVWGGELRRETVRSVPLYAQAFLATNFARLFGHVEWRINPVLLLNAGAMEETSTLTGSSLAPRLMLNWHAAPNQTLRIGVSKADRPPSIFEKEGDVRYFAISSLDQKPHLIQETYVSRGNVLPERLLAREIGYLGEFPGLHLDADIRAFHESLVGLIGTQSYALPPGTQVLPPQATQEFVNATTAVMQGVEYQLKFKPWSSTQLMINQTFMHIASSDPGTAMSAPTHAGSLILFQKLPGGVDFTLIHNRSGMMTWQRIGNILQPMSRTDLRLALPFRMGPTHGEFAAVMQNLGTPYNDYNNHFFFARQSFATVSIQY